MEEKEVTQHIIQMREDISFLCANVKAAFKRIDEQHALSDTVYEQALTLRDVAGEVKSVGGAVARLQHDVEALKGQGGRRWETVVSTGLSSVVGACIGALMALLLQ